MRGQGITGICRINEFDGHAFGAIEAILEGRKSGKLCDDLRYIVRFRKINLGCFRFFQTTENGRLSRSDEGALPANSGRGVTR